MSKSHDEKMKEQKQANARMNAHLRSGGIRSFTTLDRGKAGSPSNVFFNKWIKDGMTPRSQELKPESKTSNTKLKLIVKTLDEADLIEAFTSSREDSELHPYLLREMIKRQEAENAE